MKEYWINFMGLDKYGICSQEPIYLLGEGPKEAIKRYLESMGYKNSEVVKSENPNECNAWDVNKLDNRYLVTIHNMITLYHGTKNSKLTPKFEFNNTNNDFGSGFYTTPDKELGKEWSYAPYTDGKQSYLYSYKLNLDNLIIVDLTYIDSLTWLAILLSNRNMNCKDDAITIGNRNRFLSLYNIEIPKCDVIIGFRADDSYFKYAKHFIEGRLRKETLDRVLNLGGLGIQYVLKSEQAFACLQQEDKSKVPLRYKELYNKRDRKARSIYDQYFAQEVNLIEQGNRSGLIYDFI